MTVPHSTHRSILARSSPSDHEAKRGRLREILDAIDADAIDLRSPAALAWYLEGARVGVNPTGDPVLCVRVDRDRDVVVVHSNERDRLLAEELPAGVEVSEVEWHQALLAPGEAIQESAIAPRLRAARASLLPEELGRYRALCADAARVLTDVAGLLRPEDSERRVAGDLAAALLAEGIEPLVLLVAGHSRTGYRHPLPTTAPIGDRAMLTISARRSGMFVNLTRWVEFRGDDSDARRARALLEVEAAAFAATRPGRRLSHVLHDISLAYPRFGFDTREWTRHHQGGPTGYAGRDPRASPDASDLVTTPQAFAWNPTARGVKTEDTVLLTSLGPEVLTDDPRWPTIDIDGLRRPTALRP